MAKLTEKQIAFLKKHNMWNGDRNKSTLGMFEEGQFKDFFRRKEKIEAELSRLPDAKKKKELTGKLQAAEEKAKNKNFKQAYQDLKEVKIEARREANGYADSLSVEDLGGQVDEWGLNGETLQGLVVRLNTGMKNVRDQLSREQKASDFGSLGEAAEFLRDFKQTEVTLRSAVTGLKSVCADVTNSLKQSDPGKQLADFGHQLSILGKEHGADVTDIQRRVESAHVKYIHQGTTLSATEVQQKFDQFVNEIDAGIRQHKDVSKFQSREPAGEQIGDDTLMRNPTAWDDNPTELDKLLADLAKGNSKSEFDNVMGEIKDVETALKDEKAKNSPEFQKALKLRREKALKAMALLDRRDAKRFAKTEEQFVFNSLGDDDSLTQTKDGPKRVQRLKTFDADGIVSDLTLPPNLKKLKKEDIQTVRQEVKAKMEELLTEELKKDDSDVVFDLGLKTKEDFLLELAKAMGIDQKRCSKEEKDLLSQMAEQMVATVREKYPNKAGDGKVTFKNKDGNDTEVPTEVTIGGKKYTNPKYLTSGGVGDVLRYQEDGSNPPKYTVLKTLKDPTKRGDMVLELKLHRQANGGEEGDNSPYVVEMKGAVQGPDGEIYMAMEYADGGDLNDMGYSLAQAAQAGNISEEARNVLMQHMLREAVTGMKQVQDNNMTHHDIKGMNYLIGSDGKVKVADFGSGQVGDDQGEVPANAPHMITTQAYKAPELGGPGKVTGKADTYSLGVMLGKLSKSSQGHGPSGERGDEPVTALVKLQKAMTDPDPTKRPTLEAVLQTSYMSDFEANYDQEKIDNLVKAVMAYNQHVGNKAKKELRLVVFHQGELDALLKKKRNATSPKEHEEIDKKIDAKLLELKELQDKIDTLLAEEDSKPYLEALQKANKDLVRANGGPKRDVTKIKFKEEYEAIAKASGIPANAKLLQALTAVDQADDPETKTQLAEVAEKEAEELAKQMSAIAKSPPNEKAKLVASKLGTDLRKLKQALQEVAAVQPVSVSGEER
jgi:serine/threonine protein kinase